MAKKQNVNVGLIGCGFMGKAHSFGYRNVNEMWVPAARAVMKCIAGTEPEDIVRATAQMHGWQGYETDWRKLIARKDIDLVDISTPNFVHVEMAVAAAKAGKDILCEKPLANDLAGALTMAKAVEEAGVKAMCGFTYRQAPAVQLAKQMIDSGELGEVYHFRARYLQDWIMDPSFPLVWRLQKQFAGSGSLGDLGAHITDMALFLVGDIAEVCGDLKVFIKERPLLAGDGGTALTDRKGGARRGKVTVDDAAIWCARFANGAVGTFEATRFAGGRKNYHAWEINGSKGSVGWNFEDMNYLEYWNDGEGAKQGYRKVLATHPQTPNWKAWWPDGHIIGYGECFVNEVKEMLTAIAEDRQPVPSFRDGLRCQAVLEAVTQSAESRKWTAVPKA
jgi:predicted dehydrogenase